MPILISDSTTDGMYQLYVEKNVVLTISNENLSAEYENQGENQLFSLQKYKNDYLIIYNKDFALTYKDGLISIEKINYSKEQLWNIESNR